MGSFASPTGFVSHDPIFPPEPAKTTMDEIKADTVEIPVRNGPSEANERFRHRRLRRDEEDYSSHKRWRERRSHGHEKREKRRFRDRAVWALSVGATAAGLMYVVGIASELSRGAA